MTDVFVIRNQHGHYWGKNKAWQDGSDPRTVQRLKHLDEAINLLFELSAKDVELRGETLACELNERGQPVIEPSEVPLPGSTEDAEAVAGDPAAGDPAAGAPPDGDAALRASG